MSHLPAGAQLTVFADGVFEQHSIPKQGTILIGRSKSADVRIDHPSVSREHARLTIGPPLGITDLGSHNGTRVRGVRLVKGGGAILLAGDPISIGFATLVVQAAPSIEDASERFVSASYFEETTGHILRKGGALVVLSVAEQTMLGLDLVDAVCARAVRREDLLFRLDTETVFAGITSDSNDVLRLLAERIASGVGQLGGRVLLGAARGGVDGATPAELMKNAQQRGKAVVDETGPGDEANALVATTVALALYAAARDEEARAAAARALAILSRSKSSPVHSLCTLQLGRSAEERGDRSLAKQLYEEALAIERGAGHTASVQTLVSRIEGLRPIEAAHPPSAPLALDTRRRIVTLPDRSSVDLSRRKPLWHLVAALAEQRSRAPGRALSRDQMIEAGWQGEKVHPRAANNRLNVAIAELRKLGLRGILLSRDDGYLLDPGLELSV